MGKHQSAFFDFRRAARVLWIVVGLAWALLAADQALLILAGPAPAILATQARVNARKRARMLDAVAAARERMELARRSAEAPSSRFCIIIGSSSAMAGLDETSLDASLGKGFTVLNLSSNALGLQELDYYAQALHSGGIKASMILVAIHPVFLIEAQTSPPMGSAASDPERKSILDAPGQWLQRRWAIANLSGMHALFHNRFMELRFWLLRRFGERASALDSGLEGTGPEVAYSPLGAHAGPQLLDLQMRHWEQLGAFSPLGYSEAGEGSRALETLLLRARALAPRTVVLLLPERSDFRRRVPAQATALLSRTAASADPSCRVLDLSGAVPDQDFVDYQHVDRTGREELSRQAGEAIARLGIARSN